MEHWLCTSPPYLLRVRSQSFPQTSTVEAFLGLFSVRSIKTYILPCLLRRTKVPFSHKLLDVVLRFTGLSMISSEGAPRFYGWIQIFTLVYIHQGKQPLYQQSSQRSLGLLSHPSCFPTWKKTQKNKTGIIHCLRKKNLSWCGLLMCCRNLSTFHVDLKKKISQSKDCN